MIKKIASVTQPAHQQTQQEVQQVQNLAGIAYFSLGPPRGPAIVFLHGIGGAARQFGSILPYFATDRQAIAWDMPGHGASGPLPLVTIDALAAAVGSFIAALGLDRPVLVGHSLGGMIIQRLLVEAPHIARAVVLAQTSAAFGGRDPAWADAFIRDRLGPLDEGRSMSDLAPALVAGMLGDAPAPGAAALAEDCLAQTPASSYRDTILAMRGFDLRDALPRIAVPTLVLAGDQDRAAPAAGMQRMAQRVPGARFVVIEQAGHLAHLECPGRTASAIQDFVRSL